MVVLPDWGKPIIPSFIYLDLRIGSGILADALALAEVAELADARDSNSRSFGIEGSIPSFGIRNAPHYTLKGNKTTSNYIWRLFCYFYNSY